jgi:hypothetical protein
VEFKGLDLNLMATRPSESMILEPVWVGNLLQVQSYFNVTSIETFQRINCSMPVHVYTANDRK